MYFLLNNISEQAFIDRSITDVEEDSYVAGKMRMHLCWRRHIREWIYGVTQATTERVAAADAFTDC